VDPNLSLHRNQQALMLQAKASNPEEGRAYRQFARDYLVRIQMTRTESGEPDVFCGFPR
jgi:hypothetical protein